jgi:signal transduction histidine kinase
LTEYAIRTKQSFNPPEVQQVYQEFAPESAGKSNPSRTRSWLAVPMVSKGQVFGVIVLRNYEFENFYTDDDREILEILAGQAATALQNLRLYQAEKLAQERKSATDNMAIMSLTAAEFAHKMNNLAGTIPVRIALAKSQLDNNNPRDTKIIEQLSKIDSEANSILVAAQEIRESSEPRAPEKIDVHQLLETAIARAGNTQQNVENKVEILKIFARDLPFIQAERNSFLDTLTSIIKNGIEAIDIQGSVTVKTRRIKRFGKDFVEIEVSDTGRGIPTSDLSKVFDLFYTTKGEKGLGFGLWRDRTFIKRLGGEIDVQSEVGKGSMFTIRIPVNTNS